jgi:hypothetical protein
MPDPLTPLLFFAMMCSAVPIVIGAILGAGFGWQPIAIRQIGGAVLGLLIGLIALLPGSLLALMFVSALVPGLSGLVLAGVAACLASAWVAYVVARVGRGSPPMLTLNVLMQNCSQIERIVRERLAAAGVRHDSPLEFDAALQNAGILSFDQLALWSDIRKRKNTFMRSRVIVHEDVAVWAGRSKQLLDQLLQDESADSPLTHSGGDALNPYLPPGHRIATGNQ